MLALVVLFVFFGFWQLSRLSERREQNQLIASRMASEPEQLAGLLERYDQQEGELDYRRAFVRGRYEQENELLLRSRSRGGEPGWHLLTPLVQESGRALLVDRGWVPYRMDEPPVEEARPPEGTVEVEGLVRVEQDPPEGWAAALAPRDPPEGPLRSAYYVDVERLAAQVPHPLEPVYLQLTQQVPAGETRFPLPAEPPELENGPHLAYALQWFSFALIGVVGYALLLRRTAQGK